MQKNAAQAEQLLRAETNPYGLNLSLEKDGLECYAALHRDAAREILTFSVLRSFLSQHNITKPSTEAMSRFIKKVQETKGDVDKTKVAEGQKPQKGRDGYFELSFKPAQPGYLTPDSFDRVDFHAVQAFDNVHPEQKIGQVILPETGASGCTVTGKVIPGLLGKAAEPRIGQGARLDAKTGTIYARIDGRVVFDDRSIDVTKDYEVNGNLDYHTGHINFNGNVKITGHVLDGFNITATGNVNIGGDIGRSSIKTGGDLTLACMSGHNGGSIHCEGNLTATSLIDTHVVCQGTIHVRGEIRNATLWTRGAVIAPSGQIHGGQVISLKGIEVETAGCASGLRTILSAGFDYDLEQKKKQAWQDLQACDAELLAVSRVIRAIRKRLKPNENEPLKLIKLQDRKGSILHKKNRLAAAVDSLHAHEIEGPNAKINVHGTLHEGVIISLGETKTEIKTNREGPLSIIENPQAQGLKALPLSPLEYTAGELKEEIVVA